ncbi:MarR family winged helix-turn-helix transcriptional regulator [Cellulomonas endophytica]|uniref:MarR family winged helix-turn-helix transcriptional regulator n=1 Tax=Cellulomonas endophytica TaxID=2494735 RepID=UPI0010111F3D|nr:MarR family transcriptional regulator [Cellulomonas endophytica]
MTGSSTPAPEPAAAPRPAVALGGFPEAAVHLVRALEARRRHLAAAAGLSETDLRALFRVAEAGGLAPTGLAAELGLTNGAVTGVADRLVRAGLVRRREHPRDRRSLHLELTPHGLEQVERMHRDLQALLSAAGSGAGEDDLRTATEVLRRATAALRAAPDVAAGR